MFTITLSLLIEGILNFKQCSSCKIDNLGCETACPIWIVQTFSLSTLCKWGESRDRSVPLLVIYSHHFEGCMQCKLLSFDSGTPCFWRLILMLPQTRHIAHRCQKSAFNNNQHCPFSVRVGFCKWRTDWKKHFVQWIKEKEPKRKVLHFRHYESHEHLHESKSHYNTSRKVMKPCPDLS